MASWNVYSPGNVKMNEFERILSNKNAIMMFQKC
jgi:hypothetical protein